MKPLTYEDGYREGRASVFASKPGELIAKSHLVNEAPSRVSLLLEALVWAVMAKEET